MLIRNSLHKSIPFILLFACSSSFRAPASAQFQAGRYTLTAEEKALLSERLDHLRQALEALKEQSQKTGKPRADQIPDAEAFLNAVDLNLSQNLFFSRQNVDQAKSCL